MRAGRLRHEIVIQQRSGGTESRFGAPSSTGSWTTFKTVWARIVPLTGAERFQAQQTFESVDHRIETRWLDGVTPEMRVQYGNRTFEIEAPLNMEELDRELHLMCHEINRST